MTNIITEPSLYNIISRLEKHNNTLSSILHQLQPESLLSFTSMSTRPDITLNNIDLLTSRLFSLT
jgi:hypothetical protein